MASATLEDQQAAYKEALPIWTEARDENMEVQHHLINHFLERETPEDHVDHQREVSDEMRAEEHQRYQKCFEELLNLKAVHHGIREQAYHRYEALKSQHEKIELLAREEWTSFQETQRKMARLSRSRGGELLPEEKIEEALSKIEERVNEWRKCNLEDINVASKKLRLEERIMAQRELEGKSDRRESNSGDDGVSDAGAGGLHFQELKITLLNYQHRLKKQEHDLRQLVHREKSSVNEISHMNEKLEYLESLEESLAEKLTASEQSLESAKQRMFDAHARRDAGRKKKIQLLESSELLGRQKLTGDFQYKVQLRNELISKIKESKKAFRVLVNSPSPADQRLLDKTELIVLKDDFSDPNTVLEIIEYSANLAS